jgi:hypothetical protein
VARVLADAKSYNLTKIGFAEASDLSWFLKSLTKQTPASSGGFFWWTELQ